MAARRSKRPAEKTLRLDAGLYSPEAARAAAAAFAGRAEVFLLEEDGAASVTLRSRSADAADLGRLAGEFLNEALNQDLRLSTVRKNARLLGMLVAASLRTAAVGVLLCAWAAGAARAAPAAPAAAAAPEAAAPCPDSDPDGILRGYGTVWGKGVSDKRGIPFAESDRIVEGLIDAQSCRAIAALGGAPCAALGGLPGAANRCESIRAAVPFQLFLAGRSQDPDACRRFFSKADLGGAPEDAFCGAARRAAGRAGMAGLCPALTGGPGKGEWRKCVQLFPPDVKSCRGTREPRNCEVLARLYAALSTRDPKACPAQARRACEAALAEPSRASCAPADKDLKTVYCRAYRSAWKRTRGQVGLTDPGEKAEEEINRRLRGARGAAGAPPREDR
jgi:hypothetical protein